MNLLGFLFLAAVVLSACAAADTKIGDRAVWDAERVEIYEFQGDGEDDRHEIYTLPDGCRILFIKNRDWLNDWWRSPIPLNCIAFQIYDGPPSGYDHEDSPTWRAP